jgi:hypothetical protein
MNNPSSFDLGPCASMPQPPMPRKSEFDDLEAYKADLKEVGIARATEPLLTVSAVLPGETNPIALGDLVVSGLRSSVRAVINACVLVAEPR